MVLGGDTPHWTRLLWQVLWMPAASQDEPLFPAVRCPASWSSAVMSSCFLLYHASDAKTQHHTLTHCNHVHNGLGVHMQAWDHKTWTAWPTNQKDNREASELPRHLLEVNATQQQSKRHMVLMQHASWHSVVCYLLQHHKHTISTTQEYSVLEQGVTITGCNTNAPPCSVALEL